MKKHQKEILKLTAKEVLLSILDLTTPFFEASRQYRVSVRQFREVREFNREDFKERIKYLKRQGLISSFVENKEKYIEVTPKGVKKATLCHIDDLKIERSNTWDHKWRVVIYDIPEKNKTGRNCFQNKIKKLGFEEIQKSVYVYPFECTDIIDRVSQAFLADYHVSIMLSEIIRGEERFLEKFLKKKVLSKEDLR